MDWKACVTSLWVESKNGRAAKQVRARNKVISDHCNTGPQNTKVNSHSDYVIDDYEWGRAAHRHHSCLNMWRINHDKGMRKHIDKLKYCLFEVSTICSNQNIITFWECVIILSHAQKLMLASKWRKTPHKYKITRQKKCCCTIKLTLFLLSRLKWKVKTN